MPRLLFTMRYIVVNIAFLVLLLQLVVVEMPSHGWQVSDELRCCVVCLRATLPPPTNSFVRIGRLLRLNERTCAQIWQRASQCACSVDLTEVLACVGDLERQGRPQRIVDGTLASAHLRALIINLDDQ